jgi:radical SAM protein with 4Fe4S-binding SPASM domain
LEKVVERYQLRIVFWETTAACNLRCRHCRRLSTGAGAREFGTDEAKAWIGSLGDWCRPLLILSGGEPLIRPDIVELASFARERGSAVALATNGLLMTEKIAGELSRAGVRRVGVSLDGASAETHDGLRGVRGAFDAALSALRFVRAAEVSTQINMTVCRGNRDEIEEVLLLAEREGVQAVHLFVFVPVGCGLDWGKDRSLSAVECEELLHWFRKREGSMSIEMRLTCAPQYQRILAEDEREGAAGRVGEPAGDCAAGPSGCLGGKSVCFVSHVGDVFPCGYLPVAAGNVRERSLKEIWEGSELFRELRDADRLGAPCGMCAYKVTCGGCRARACAATGDYLGGDRSCLNPKLDSSIA